MPKDNEAFLGRHPITREEAISGRRGCTTLVKQTIHPYRRRSAYGGNSPSLPRSSLVAFLPYKQHVSGWSSANGALITDALWVFFS